MGEGKLASSSSYGDSITLKELKVMKKEMERIKEENKILKKSMVILANN